MMMMMIPPLPALHAQQPYWEALEATQSAESEVCRLRAAHAELQDSAARAQAVRGRLGVV